MLDLSSDQVTVSMQWLNRRSTTAGPSPAVQSYNVNPRPPTLVDEPQMSD